MIFLALDIFIAGVQTINSAARYYRYTDKSQSGLKTISISIGFVVSVHLEPFVRFHVCPGNAPCN